MPHSHAIEVNASSNAAPLQQLNQQLRALRKRSRTQDAFDTLERELHPVFAEAERTCLEPLLSDYDIDVETFAWADKTYRRSHRCRKRYMTVAGEINVERSLTRHTRNGETDCPLELNAGMVEQFWTPHAAKQAIHRVSLVTPAEAETVFEELGHMQPSKSSLDRLPKQLSDHWEAQRESLEAQLCEQLKVPDEATMLSVSLDGVWVPTRYTR